MTNILQSKWIFLLLATALPGLIAAQTEPTCKAHNTRLPYPTDCTKYYLCLWNPANGTLERFLQKCPTSLKFSVEGQGCSSTSICVETPLACGSNPFVCVTTSSYQVCVDGTATGAATACPTGLICDPDCTSPCSFAPCPPFACTAQGIFGIEGDCTRYGFCFETAPGKFDLKLDTCPVGRFDVSKKLCTQMTPVVCA